MKKANVVFRVDANPAADAQPGAPYALFSPLDEIVRVGSSVRLLADLAFDVFHADEVRHAYLEVPRE